MSLPVIPSLWKYEKLVDVIDQSIDYRGKTPTKTESGVPLITAKNVKGGKLSPEPREYIAEAAYIDWMSRGYPQTGDVLFTTEAPLGEVAQVSDPNIALAQRLLTLRGKKSILDNDYLKWVFFSPAVKFQIGQRSTGSTVRGIRQKELRQVKIPLPPLEEQRRIAAVLEKADHLRSLRRQALARLDDLVQSVFLEMFGDPVTNPMGWEKKPLTNFVDLISGFAFKSKDYLESDPDAVKLCRGINIGLGSFDWSPEKTAYWPKNEIEKYHKFELLENDIVVAMDRPWISGGFKHSLISKKDLPAFLVQRVSRIRVKKSEYVPFLLSLLNSSYFERHCNLTETTVPHISPKDFNTFEVPLPPENFIKKFAMTTEHYSQLKVTADIQIKSLDNLFNSLMQKAFKGELQFAEAEQSFKQLELSF